jgi:hypothetical protein
MSVYKMTQNNSQLMTQNNWRHMFEDAIKSGEVTLKKTAREERAKILIKRFDIKINDFKEYRCKDLTLADSKRLLYVYYADVSQFYDNDKCCKRLLTMYNAESLHYYENDELQTIKKNLEAMEVWKNQNFKMTNEFGKFLLGIYKRITSGEYLREKYWGDLLGRIPYSGNHHCDLYRHYEVWYHENYMLFEDAETIEAITRQGGVWIGE